MRGGYHRPVASFLQRRIVNPLVALLRQGTSPRKLACSLACGVVCGLFPVVGTTTILCALVALLFGLNLPAAQLVNYFLYPLQLVLIVPFMRAGEVILHAQRTRLSLEQMIAIFRHNHMQALHDLWRLTVHGIVAWLVFAPFLFAVVYAVVLPPIARMARSMARRRGAAAATP
jgi:uncharacterized protein (DUF2062 family)